MKLNNAALTVLLMMLGALARPSLAILGLRQRVRPCKWSEDPHRHGCVNRFKPCGWHRPSRYARRISMGNGPTCKDMKGDPYFPYPYNSFIVQFDGKAGCKEIYMAQGECW